METDLAISNIKDALSYAADYRNATIVVKIGGSLLTDASLYDSFSQDIVYVSNHVRTVIVHGGGKQANDLVEKLGIVPVKIDGDRVTDEETLKVVKMLYAGLIKTDLVASLQRYGVPAFGFSGVDGNTLHAEKKERADGRDLGFVGDITEVNLAAINFLLEKGYVPVVASLAMGDNGVVYNVNADIVAGRIAAALKARKFINMTNVDGVYEDVNDPSTIIPYMTDEEAKKLLERHVFEKGMIPKMESCLIAIEGGVQRTHIINGEKKNTLLAELYTSEGIGTMIAGAAEIEKYKKELGKK